MLVNRTGRAADGLRVMSEKWHSAPRRAGRTTLDEAEKSSSNVKLFTLSALNLPVECHVCSRANRKKRGSCGSGILTLVLSRDAQLNLNFMEQIGIVVEASRQWLRRLPVTK